MTYKTCGLYNKVFNIIKNLIDELKIKIDYNKNIFVSDFEKALRGGIAENLPNSNFEDCFFHYAKLLWLYAKKIHFAIKNFSLKLVYSYFV